MGIKYEMIKENSRKLFEAVLANNLHEVQSITKLQNFNINYKSEDENGEEYDIITLASKLNNLEVVKILLKHSPQFLPINNNYTDNESLAIIFASENNNLEILKLLLEHGMQVSPDHELPENIQNMVETAELAYRIYGLDYLEEKDNKLINEIEQDTILQKLFLNSFKNYLRCKENLPGTDETLLEYGEHIKTKYGNTFNELLLAKVVIIIESTHQDYIGDINSAITTLGLDNTKPMDEQLETFLNNFKQSDDSLIKQTIFSLEGNKALGHEIKTRIIEYIVLLEENDIILENLNLAGEN